MSSFTGDCIVWDKALSAAGYGVRNVDGVVQYVHRLAYVEAQGPVPEGLELDHLCRNRACYNAAHLEAVTHAENMKRGHFGMKTHCPQGHPYDEVNTYLGAKGGRQCRACKEVRRTAVRIGPARSKTHCVHGHPKTPENRMKSGHCRPCNIVKQAAYKARKKAQGA